MRAKQKFKKGTFSRRVFSVLMALAMVISLMPMNAMEVKAEDATKQITSMNLNVDWSKIPTLIVGQSAPSFEKPPVTVSGTGVGGITGCGWSVKALPEHVASGYIDQDVYDGFATYDYWVPLNMYENYTINATDTYACSIGSCASEGYCFAEERGVDLKDIVTSNVNVAQILSDGDGSRAIAFLKLGTVSEIEDAKGGATSTKKITSMTLNVDWSKIPTLKVGQSAPSFEECPATASGTGVGGIEGCGWVVKALPEHVESGYIDQNVYDRYETFDHWVPLYSYKNYTINATDTYACFIVSLASAGYCFAERDGVDLKDIVTSNVDVAQIQSNDGGLYAVAFLKLGTVSEIEDAKGGATSTKHTITATAGANGSISPNGEVQVKEGDDQTFIITPNAGYEIDTLTVDGAAETASSSYTFSDVTAAHTIDVTFKQKSQTPTTPTTPTAPTTPTTPTTPTENYTIPVKNENTAEVKAEIKDGTANVSEITTDTIDKVINNKDTELKVDTITIDLSGAKQEVTGVTLSKKSVETLAKTTSDKDNGIETATIELSKATVVLDNKTLETLVEQAKGSKIELVVADTKQNNLNTAQQTTLKDYQVSTTFEAYFTSDGARIHDFNGGTAVVSIKFTPETGRDSSFYHLVYVADDGKLTRYKTKYQGGKLMFTTTHFSDYAVIYDTSEKNETDTEETPKEEEKKDDGTGAEEKVTLDTTYRKLQLRVPATTKTTNVLKWTKVSDADGYVIYGNKCNTKGKTYKMQQQAVIKDNATTTWTDKKLASGTYYKYCIKAYKLVDGKKVWIAKSKVVHSTTTGGNYGNAKSVKVNKTAVSLAVQKTFTIKAEQIVKDQPIKKHTDIKFESSNSKIASVTSKGVIKAKKKGTCYIYVYAQNGIYQKIKVTVK